jgi:hypothetical protein
MQKPEPSLADSSRSSHFVSGGLIFILSAILILSAPVFRAQLEKGERPAAKFW